MIKRINITRRYREKSFVASFPFAKIVKAERRGKWKRSFQSCFCRGASCPEASGNGVFRVASAEAPPVLWKDSESRAQRQVENGEFRVVGLWKNERNRPLFCNFFRHNLRKMWDIFRIFVRFTTNKKKYDRRREI